MNYGKLLTASYHYWLSEWARLSYQEYFKKKKEGRKKSLAIKGRDFFIPFNLGKVEYLSSDYIENGLCPELIPQQMF